MVRKRGPLAAGVGGAKFLMSQFLYLIQMGEVVICKPFNAGFALIKISHPSRLLTTPESHQGAGGREIPPCLCASAVRVRGKAAISESTKRSAHPPLVCICSNVRQFHLLQPRPHNCYTAKKVRTVNPSRATLKTTMQFKFWSSVGELYIVIHGFIHTPMVTKGSPNNGPRVNGVIGGHRKIAIF